MPPPDKPRGLPPQVHGWQWLALGLFLATVLFVGLRPGILLWPDTRWPEAVLLLLGIAATLATSFPQLAFTNVASAGLICALLGGLAAAVDQVTHCPFGGWNFGAASGPQRFGIVPWSAPWLWLIAALNARAVSRWFLQAGQRRPYHGYRVIALSSVLATGFLLACVLFGNRLELWQLPLTSTALAGLFGLTLLQQIIITPLLLDKFPHPRPASPLPLLVTAPSILLILLTLATR